MHCSVIWLKMNAGYVIIPESLISATCWYPAEIPLQEALQGKVPRKIFGNDFKTVLNNRQSSIIPWQRMAIEQVKKIGEEDLFKDLMKIGILKT